MNREPAPVKEAIILAGGLGTRLRDAVPGLPKCMAPVAGHPFLFHVIRYLRQQGIERFIFSLGYKYELIESYLQQQFPYLNWTCTIEEQPLGTGGAVQLAARKATGNDVLVVNGDTIFRADLAALSKVHHQQQAAATLALKPMQSFDRYGTVQLNSNGLIEQFEEKKFCTEGLINGGVYLLHLPAFFADDRPDRFSFEKEFLETGAHRLAGLVQDAYFIDIGIPEDYERAQQELAGPPIDLHGIDRRWTLFLDRDGVINVDKEGSYIFNADEFHFMEGAPGLFSKLADRFGRIIVVTNQRGIGRGMMSIDDLAGIHQKMIHSIEAAGGRIDRIFFATSTNNDDPLRKPQTGMARQAMEDFPEIDPVRCIMVGNNHSDMLFGRNAGMYTVFLATTNPGMPFPHPDIDFRFNLLDEFAKAL